MARRKGPAGRSRANGDRAQTLLVIASAFAALMGLTAVFAVGRASIGAGSAVTNWTEAGASLVAGLLALGILWLARSGSEALAAWLIVALVAVRVALSATVTVPYSFAEIWPFYLASIVLAQVLISSQAGMIVSLGAIIMFAFTYQAVSGSPEAAEGVPLAAMSNVLLYVMVGVVVHIATSRVTRALRRSDELLSSHDRARTELREREEQFRALADSSATGIVIHQDGRLVYGNPHFFEMARCMSDDCFGLSLWDFFDQAAGEQLQTQLSRRRLGGARPVQPDLLLFQPTKGPELWCEVAVADAVFWQKPAIVANVLDVTERVQAQLQVQHERDFSNNIINTAGALIMVLDGDARLVLLNPAAQRITGYTQEDLQAGPFWEVLCPEETREQTRQIFIEAKAGEARGQVEGPWLTKGGEEITIAWHYVAQYDQQGELTMMVAVGIDVTQQRLLERQSVVTERLRSMGQIAGGVAHDLNNMLAGIMGPADLLLMQETEPARERALKAILAAATRGAETVRRIQSFSKARTDLDRQVFDLREMAEDVIFSLRPRWRDAAHKIGVRIEVRDEVPAGITVHASAGEIGNVLMNLIVNACEAMPADGEIVVTGQAKDNAVQFQVQDNGSGIPAEAIEHIFQPFYSTKGADNSGLGLAVIHGIILRHGGTISVDSEVGQGTTFTMTLPTAVSAPAAPVQASEGKAPAGHLRILAVDDVPDIADYVVAIAQRSGHEAQAAYESEAAVERLEVEPFDVLITDYGMEGISGPDLAERARALRPDIKVVLITGWDVSAEEFEGLHSVLKKPCTREQVQEVLAELAELAAAVGH